MSASASSIHWPDRAPSVIRRGVVEVAAISTGHPLRTLSLVWSSMGHSSRVVLGTTRDLKAGAEPAPVAGPSSLHAKMKPTRRALPRFWKSGRRGSSPNF